MQGLVEDLMSLSRIEALKHQQPTEMVDLVAVARLCMGEVTEQDRVTLSTDVETAPILGDQGQLAQVLRNLVENAFKYGSADGQIRISLEKGQTGWISVSVADEGEALRRNTCRASQSAFIGRMPHDRDRPAAPAWASPS